MPIVRPENQKNSIDTTGGQYNKTMSAVNGTLITIVFRASIMLIAQNSFK